MYGILGIPAKLVFLVLKHALKFLGLWKGLSEGAKALKDGAKKLLKTGVSVVKNFASDLFGGKKKVEAKEGDDAIESFNSVEQEIMEREKANENKLTEDGAAKKARQMCGACPMAIKFMFALSLVDVFVGFGIGGFKVALALNLGNIPSLAGCAVGCMKVVFSAFTLFKERNQAKKAQDAYFGASCNPHSMGMCMMLGRVQQCGTKWSTLPDVGGKPHPLKVVSTQKPYMSIGDKASSALKTVKSWVEIESSTTRSKNGRRLKLGHGASMRSQRMKKGDEKEEAAAKEQKKEAAKTKKAGEQGEAKIAAASKRSEEAGEAKPLSKDEVAELPINLKGGQLCKLFAGMSPFTVMKNHGKDDKSNPQECGGFTKRVAGDDRKDTCNEEAVKTGTCAKMDLEEGCRRTLKTMSQDTKNKNKNKETKGMCGIAALEPNSMNLYRRCREILGCMTPFSPAVGQTPPFKLTPEKISATILQFMKRIDSQGEMSSERTLSPSEATDELVKKLNLFSKQSDASTSNLYSTSQRCVFAWNIRPRHIWRDELWSEQCQTDNWKSTSYKVLSRVMGFADAFHAKPSNKAISDTYNSGRMLADMLGASTGVNKHTCTCRCCRNTEKDDATAGEHCQPTLAGIIKLPPKSWGALSDTALYCSGKVCANTFPTQCPNDPRELLVNALRCCFSRCCAFVLLGNVCFISGTRAARLTYVYTIYAPATPPPLRAHPALLCPPLPQHVSYSVSFVSSKEEAGLIEGSSGAVSKWARGVTYYLGKADGTPPPTCEESAMFVQNMIQNATFLENLGEKALKQSGRRAIETTACEKLLEEIESNRVAEATKDARAAAADVAEQAGDDPIAKAEAADQLDPFAEAEQAGSKTK